MSVSELALHKVSRFTHPVLAQRPMSKQRNILLIDDDEIFIFLTSKMLQSTEIAGTINVSYSAMEAIRHLDLIKNTSSIPDIIFLDLNMPEMNGWEFLQHYQQLLPKLKKKPSLFVVSSSIAENDAERAMKIKGVSGYIAKPIDTNSLFRILKMY